MKNEGFTQGPFYAVVNEFGAWSVQIGPGQYDQSIAYIGKGNAYIETGSAKGNAQLFAAAPDLLSALKEMVKTWQEDVGDLHEKDPALLAIAKAEGRA